MRLLLWLLLLIEMVPVFTLSDSFGVIPSLAGMVNPNLWLHLISKSLVMLTAAEGYSHPGQQDDTASSVVEPQSHCLRRPTASLREYRGVGSSPWSRRASGPHRLAG